MPYGYTPSYTAKQLFCFLYASEGAFSAKTVPAENRASTAAGSTIKEHVGQDYSGMDDERGMVNDEQMNMWTRKIG